MTERLQNRCVRRLVDLSLVCLPAVHRAAYSLGERFDVLLERQGDHASNYLFRSKGMGRSRLQ